MRIAIVGGGASGLITAWLLDRAHEVTLFERAPVLGGHIRTLGRNAPRGDLPAGLWLDAGVVEFSREMRRRPFVPFTLVMVDGQRITVDHPEFAATDRRGRVVTYYGSDNIRHEIDARLIVEIVSVDRV